MGVEIDQARQKEPQGNEDAKVTEKKLMMEKPLHPMIEAALPAIVTSFETNTQEYRNLISPETVKMTGRDDEGFHDLLSGYIVNKLVSASRHFDPGYARWSYTRNCCNGGTGFELYHLSSKNVTSEQIVDGVIQVGNRWAKGLDRYNDRFGDGTVSRMNNVLRGKFKNNILYRGALIALSDLFTRMITEERYRIKQSQTAFEVNYWLHKRINRNTVVPFEYNDDGNQTKRKITIKNPPKFEEKCGGIQIQEKFYTAKIKRQGDLTDPAEFITRIGVVGDSLIRTMVLALTSEEYRQFILPYGMSEQYYAQLLTKGMVQ